MVRFPYLYRRLTALAQRRLPNPRSRLRRAILRRASISAYAAFNRRDFKLMLVRYAPDVEFEFDPGLQTLDLSGTFRGHQEILDGLDQLADGFPLRLEPAYLLDLGDRVLALGFQRAHGRASGVQLEQEFAQLVTVREGLVVRDQAWFRWEEGCEPRGSIRIPSPFPLAKSSGQAPDRARPAAPAEAAAFALRFK
jgi:ketosteroid isomerase-like protein